MKKISLLLAALMIAGSASGWCGPERADGFIDSHTKDSSFRPVQDAGMLYGTMDHTIHSSLDKVPVVKERSVVIHPVETLMGQTIDAGRTLINGTWDLLTLKRLREKK